MPYIKQDERRPLEGPLFTLVQRMGSGAGVLNFCISKLCSIWLRGRTNYSDINKVIGALECVKLELYRRIAAPYEDGKIQENGDVY